MGAGWEDDGGRKDVCVCVCVETGGGRVTLNSWVDVNKAVTVWMEILYCYLCCLLSLSFHQPSSLATSGQHLLSSFMPPRPPSRCKPPLPGSLVAIKHLTGTVPQLALVSNQWTHTQAYSNTQNHTRPVDHMKLMISAAAAKWEKWMSLERRHNVITVKYWELCHKYL